MKIRVMSFKKMSLLIVFAGFLLSACMEEKVVTVATNDELGKLLFFDPILSRDSTISCASCHIPEFAFADTSAVSDGIHGLRGERNTPSVMNLVDRNFYFWDGRAETLEEQALGPMENRVEMDMPVTSIIRRLKRNEFYRAAFKSVYGKAPSAALLSDAIAAYEKTLETSESPFDHYMKGEDTTEFSESAKRGLTIFNNKGKCFDCHFGPDFTGNDKFRNIGLYNGKELNDKGRFNISGKYADLGAFKISGLRNIAQTAPYMHNGMFKTLREVIDYYNEPDKIVPNSINRDSLLNKPLNLTLTEKKDLENFLLSLSDVQFTKK